MSSPSLYERVLGADYALLAPAVQRFHRLSGFKELHGWVETQAAQSPIAKLLAWCFGTPRRAASGPLRFTLRAEPEQETWTRYFPHQTMVSCLRIANGGVEEQLGPARLTFGLRAAEGKLSMHLLKLRCFGLPCPKWLMPRILAQEHGLDDRLHFHVKAELPHIGWLAAYRGYLVVPQERS